MLHGWLTPPALRRPLAWAGAVGALALALLVFAALDEDDPPPPVPIRHRLWLAAGTGLAAFAVGLSWGRWLEGPRSADPKRRDQDED